MPAPPAAPASCEGTAAYSRSGAVADEDEGTAGDAPELRGGIGGVAFEAAKVSVEAVLGSADAETEVGFAAGAAAEREADVEEAPSVEEVEE